MPPQYKPDPIGPIRDINDLVAYIQREQQRLSAAFEAALDQRVIMQARPPKKVFNGLVVGADGFNWNPGSGRGIYLYQDNAWHFIGGSQALTPIVEPEPLPVDTPPGQEEPPPPPPPPDDGDGTVDPPPTEEPPPDPIPLPPPDTSNVPVEGLAITTFHSIGLYWNPPEVPRDSGGAAVDYVVMDYKKESDVSYQWGHPLWYDARIGQAKGSIVHCDPGTRYNVRFYLPDDLATPVAQILAVTWSDTSNWKIWKTRKPSDGTLIVSPGQRLTITESGNADNGFIIYDGEGAVIDVNNTSANAMLVQADYVFLRNFILRGAQIDGLLITAGHHDIVIEDNEISEWGRHVNTTRNGWQVGGSYEDAGIRSLAAQENETSQNTGGCYRLVIQRNKIYNPRYGANSWSEGHPHGCKGIHLTNCERGNNVIRYNDVFSDKGVEHWFTDAIGGGENFNPYAGAPGPDSDIYGNYMDNSWDDSLEAEGSGRNVRIWGNYIGQSGIGIATTVVAQGPMYIWRNVRGGMSLTNYWRSVRDSSGNLIGYVDRRWDLGDRNGAFKNLDTQGQASTFGSGRRYVYHNTVLMAPPEGLARIPELVQPGDPATLLPIGAGSGLSEDARNTKSRNNIYQTWKPNWQAIPSGSDASCDFDYDMYSSDSVSRGGSHMVHAPWEGSTASNRIKFQTGHGWAQWEGGYYQLDPTSPGYQAGEVIANFGTMFGEPIAGAQPDIGAHEGGSSQMIFGRLSSTK